MNKINYPRMECFRTSPKIFVRDFQGVLSLVFVGMQYEISIHSRQRAQGLLSVQQESHTGFICSAEVHKQDVLCQTSTSAIPHGKHIWEMGWRDLSASPQCFNVQVAGCCNRLLATETGSASLQNILQGEKNEKTDCGASNEQNTSAHVHWL